MESVFNVAVLFIGLETSCHPTNAVEIVLVNRCLNKIFLKVINSDTATKSDQSISENAKNIKRWLDSISIAEKEELDDLVCAFFYRTAIPFHVVESYSFQNLVAKLRPSYKNHLPNRKALSGRLLDSFYNKYRTIAKDMIEKSLYYCITTDGWSNLRNEHLVNFTIHIPQKKPLFWKSLDTSGVEQTGENIADEIIKVANELGVKKLVAVVTDNTSNMKKSWKIIEEIYPKVFANGCGAHVMNLLIKDICELEIVSNLLQKSLSVVKFIRNNQSVLHEFNTVRHGLKIGCSLIIPVCTRWYSQYNFLKNLYQNKSTITLLMSDDSNALKKMKKQKLDSIIQILQQIDLWKQVKEVCEILKYPSNLIGKLENDSTTLDEVYSAFSSLKSYYELCNCLNLVGKNTLLNIVENRWKFIHTQSLDFSYVLKPGNSYGNGIINGNLLQTINQLKEFIKRFFETEDEVKQCCKELNDYLSQFGFMQIDEQREYNEMSPLCYWSIYGRAKFPLLFKVALPLYCIPTSSAASERVWKVFSFVHSNRRNRLQNEKVEKLAFVYANSALLDNEDNFDYIDIEDETSE